ncbi:zinc finger, C2H2-type domain containing protein, transcription factor [Pseudohyphozyma bogoriensis]|nr:zinc finger, C2H2-type domain containing protein, transcription factor [Pseudohyphozyma bogoriensis]
MLTGVDAHSSTVRLRRVYRHVQAKHRGSKEFVCSVCGKGFARKDIYPPPPRQVYTPSSLSYHAPAAVASAPVAAPAPPPSTVFTSISAPPPPAVFTSPPATVGGTSYTEFGRPASHLDGTLSSSDFLDLVTSASAGSELDWEILNSEFVPRDGGTGFTPREGNSPGQADLESSLLLHERANANMDIPTNPTLHLDTSHVSEMFPVDDLSSVQDSAAVSLLQLASHTPRQSPEPGTPAAAASPVPKMEAVEVAMEEEAKGQGDADAEAEAENGTEEEKPRSSHTSHSPADPWPLSYRPTDAQEDILPSGRSRAPTPIRDFDTVPNVVPRVTPATRQRVLDNVRDISKGSPHFDHSDRFVPQLPMFDLFIQLFFHNYHTLLPIMHAPTFDPNTSPSFLVLAIAAIGARYAHDMVKGASVYAHALSETTRRMLEVVGEMDQTLMRTVAWIQALLLTLHGGLVSGDKRDLERSQSLSGMPITFCRRQGWLKEPEVDRDAEASFPLEERWTRWKNREEIKRLGYATIMLDGMGTVMWDLESSSLFAEAASAGLPCPDQLWEAPTPAAWEVLLPSTPLPPRSLDLSVAISQISDKTQHASDALVSASRDLFAMNVVLLVLHCMNWRAGRQTQLLSQFLEKKDGEEMGKQTHEVNEALKAGLQFFPDRVLLPPELMAVLGDSSGSSLTESLSLLLHLTAMTSQLPLRLLQALARTGSTPPSTIAKSISAWAAEDGGRTARRTLWHAGQLLGLTKLVGSDTPLEPFAIFYSALVVVAYLDYGEIGSTKGDRIEVDRLVDKDDAELNKWLESGIGTVWLSGLEVALDDEDGVGGVVLRGCGERLLGLKVWKVGELLGRTLLELENSGRGGRSVVIKQE